MQADNKPHSVDSFCGEESKSVNQEAETEAKTEDSCQYSFIDAVIAYCSDTATARPMINALRLCRSWVPSCPSIDGIIGCRNGEPRPLAASHARSQQE